MKYIKQIKTFAILGFIFFSVGCFKDLDTVPLDKKIVTSGVVYDNPEAYIQVLAKLYAGLSLSGQQGAAGQPDIEGIDEGFGQYLRGYWYHQELPTDEAVIGWNDQTIKDFHAQTWDSEDGFTFAFYSRVFYQIPLCNEFLRETTDDKLDERGVDEVLKQEIQGYRAEARFLRALSYWHALDIFRNVPFVTEDDKVGSFFPEQIQGPDLFNYIESELLDLEDKIAAARQNEYGRADQGAVWMLLAKLYLNAEVYTGTSKYAETLSYCEKLINGGYTLEPEYQHLFLADNHNSNEVIFPVTFDGVHTRTWGGMTFIIRAGIGGTMDPSYSGVVSGWGGTRTTKEMIAKFGEISNVVVAPSEGMTANYPKVYIPGSYNDWNYDDNNNSLSQVGSEKIYEGHRYFKDDNSEFLITKIPTQALIFGDNGQDGTLESNGEPILVGEAGLYYIQVNFEDNTYTLEKRDFGIIGDATPVGWDEDIDMEWDADLEALKVSTDLVAGGLKFRANDDWVVNYGDTGADALLDFDGDNITVGNVGPVEIFLYLDKPDYTYQINSTSFDTRPAFYSDGQSLEINDLTLFTEGYAVNKFRNITSDGIQGSDSEFPDTDFPMFRLADAYLMAAEAILRDGGSVDQATNYFNEVRQRAYKGTGGNISSSELTLDLILDERARELYWECHRRTDLIRYNKFSQSDYLWEWKGDVKEGISVGKHRDIFPIPSADLTANENLIQNEGY